MLPPPLLKTYMLCCAVASPLSRSPLVLHLCGRWVLPPVKAQCSLTSFQPSKVFSEFSFKEAISILLGSSVRCYSSCDFLFYLGSLSLSFGGRDSEVVLQDMAFIGAPPHPSRVEEVVEGGAGICSGGAPQPGMGRAPQQPYCPH